MKKKIVMLSLIRTNFQMLSLYSWTFFLLFFLIHAYIYIYIWIQQRKKGCTNYYFFPSPFYIRESMCFVYVGSSRERDKMGERMVFIVKDYSSNRLLRARNLWFVRCTFSRPYNAWVWMPTSNYSWQDHLCLNILSWEFKHVPSSISCM
jgi:hypothetical protein